MNSTETSENSQPPSIKLFGLLLRPRQTLTPFAGGEHIPFTALWSVISAAGIIFYLLLPIYPRAGFEYADFLVTLALLSPFVGLIALRIAGWILSKSGRFFGGKANTRLCHGALAAGLLPIGVSLVISLPIFVIHPNQPVREMDLGFFVAISQLIGTVWGLTSVVKAVSAIHQIKALHAVVALLGMTGFMFAMVNLLSIFLS